MDRHNPDTESAKENVDLEISEELKAEILQYTENNKIPCERARSLAHKHGVSTRIVGAAIDALNIKIYDCGLGCF